MKMVLRNGWQNDERGKPIHVSRGDGNELWIERDGNGHIASWKENDNDKIIYKLTYNEDGKIEYREGSDGSEDWYEHDDEGNNIYIKSSSPFDSDKEWFREYNGNKCVHEKYLDGDELKREEFYEYDEEGYMSHKNRIKSDGREIDFWYEYEYGENEKPLKMYVYRAM